MTGHDALMLLYGIMGGLFIWPIYRLFNPWKCSCGHIHWSTKRMFHHLEMKHSHEVRKK